MVQTARPATTAAEPPAPARSGVARTRITAALVVLVLLTTALLLVRLGAEERGGPPHLDLSIGSGLPATFYVPGKLDNGQFPLARPAGQRPPVVVVAHGYSADQQIMSSLARSLARAGYAVLTFDFRGHGSNTSEFKGDLRRDFQTAVDWVATSPYVDSSRIAVLGHSMGAGAVLDFGTIDTRPKAVIPVSGGNEINDAHLPPNVLFLRAKRDPSQIGDRQKELAAQLAGKTNVQSVVIGGTDHVTILWSGKTVNALTAFLDPIMGVTRSAPAGMHDPRLGTTLLYLLVAGLVIALLGLLVGRFVTPIASTTGAGSLLLVGGSLVVTMPLLATGGFPLLPLGASEPIIVHLALAAAVLWTLRLLVGRGTVTGRVARWLGDTATPWLPLRSVAVPGIAAGLAMFVLLAPAGVVFHRLVPTVDRLVLWIALTALALPFFAAFEAVVRRGTTGASIRRGLLGRLLLLGVLVVGVFAGVMPFVIILVVPLLVLQYVFLEIFAGAAYSVGRNPAVIAVVDAVFIAWLAVMLSPLG